MDIYTTEVTIIVHRNTSKFKKFQGVEIFPFNPCYIEKGTLITLPIGNKKMTFAKAEAGWMKGNKISYSITLETGMRIRSPKEIGEIGELLRMEDYNEI